MTASMDANARYLTFGSSFPYPKDAGGSLQEVKFRDHPGVARYATT